MDGMSEALIDYDRDKSTSMVSSPNPSRGNEAAAMFSPRCSSYSSAMTSEPDAVYDAKKSMLMASSLSTTRGDTSITASSSLCSLPLRVSAYGFNGSNS